MRIRWVALPTAALSLLACGGQADDGGRHPIEFGAAVTPPATTEPSALATTSPTPTDPVEPVADSAPASIEAFSEETVFIEDPVADPPPQAGTETPAARVETTTVSETAIDTVLSECRLWLDVVDSPLKEQDIVVRFGELQLSALANPVFCEDVLGWALAKDAGGTWLSFCPASCDEVRSAPETPLTIETTYWTDSSRLTR